MRTIIAGSGDVVYFMARSLAAAGHEVTLVSSDHPFCLRMAEITPARVVSGDPTLPVVLLQAGADEANALLALSASDPENLISCALASRVFRIPRTFSLVNDPDNRDLFAKIGVTRTLSPVSIVSGFVSASVAEDTILNLFTLENERFVASEVEVDGNSDSVGKRIADIRMPRGAVLSVVIRGDELIAPHSDTLLAPGDRVVLITVPSAQRAAIQVLARLQ